MTPETALNQLRADGISDDEILLRILGRRGVRRLHDAERLAMQRRDITELRRDGHTLPEIVTYLQAAYGIGRSQAYALVSSQYAVATGRENVDDSGMESTRSTS
jgi:hypothetical protein